MVDSAESKRCSTGSSAVAVLTLFVPYSLLSWKLEEEVNFSSKWGKHWATLLHWEQRSVGEHDDACTTGLSSAKELLDLSPWTPIPAVSYCQKACGASTCKCQIFEINYCRYLWCACYRVDYDESHGKSGGSYTVAVHWTHLTWDDTMTQHCLGVPEVHSFVARCGDIPTMTTFRRSRQAQH